MLQGRGCAQIAGNFKGFLKLINFLFFELFEIEKIGFEWLCVFIEPSGSHYSFMKKVANSDALVNVIQPT